MRLGRLAARGLRFFGYKLAPWDAWVVRDAFEPELKRSIDRVISETMTSAARIASLDDAVRHVIHAGVEGSFVECGVWRGGSAMAMAYALLDVGTTDRELFLFDTFEGMPAPTHLDRAGGRQALDLLAESDRLTSRVWAVAGCDVVSTNMRKTGYPSDRVHLVRGRVEDTIPERAPEQIALLRLDTDWYESTKHELDHLWSRLSVGGILIVDDYGHWDGVRKAVDEFFAEHAPPVFLHRVDRCARLIVKPPSVS